MAFIVTKDGKRIQIEYSTRFVSEQCAIYDDNVEMFDVYILNLYRRDTLAPTTEPELVKQVVFHDKPTKDQILYQMRINGISMYGIATVETGYILDFADDEK